MNCTTLEAGGRLVVVDVGVTFPERELGIDVIHPDFSSVLDREQDLEAVVITHGHEDHIGAVPYLLRELERDVPVYGPAYALALIEERLRDVDVGRPVRLIEVRPRQELTLGPLSITPYRVTHSIPDSTGLVVRCGELTIVHSGDFKIEAEPLDGEHFDEDFLTEVGDRGVRALFSDSTNAEVEGEAGGELGVAAALDGYIARAKARLVISTFGSNVHRLSAILKSAAAHKRRVLLLGRSLQTHARIAERLGRLPPLGPLLIAEKEARDLPRHQLLVVATGSQGEPVAALRRLASGTHHLLTLEPDDEVLLSSRIIPGRERQVAHLVDALARRGVRVHTRREDPAVHVSGHAHRGEQRRLIEIVRPTTFVPIHGTFTQRRRHAELARGLGVHETLMIDNGQVLELDAGRARVVGEVASGRVHVQHGEPVSDEVLHHRMHMSEGGVVLVMIEPGPGGSVARPPRVVCRGVADDVELADLKVAEQAERAALRALRMLERDAPDESIQLAVERAVRRVFRDALGFRPLVHAVIQRTTG
jgi:ribonuclease J